MTTLKTINLKDNNISIEPTSYFNKTFKDFLIGIGELPSDSTNDIDNKEP